MYTLLNNLICNFQVKIDLKNLLDLYKNGQSISLNLPLRQITGPVYSGSYQLHLKPVEEKGSITFSLQVPSLYRNMCGCFLEYTRNIFGLYTSREIYVSFYNNRFYCYDGPYGVDSILMYTIVGGSIINVSEEFYVEMESRPLVYRISCNVHSKDQIFLLGHVDNEDSSNRSWWKIIFKTYFAKT